MNSDARSPVHSRALAVNDMDIAARYRGTGRSASISPLTAADGSPLVAYLVVSAGGTTSPRREALVEPRAGVDGVDVSGV